MESVRVTHEELPFGAGRLVRLKSMLVVTPHAIRRPRRSCLSLMVHPVDEMFEEIEL